MAENFTKKLPNEHTLLLEFPELGKILEHMDYRLFIIDNYSLIYKDLEAEIFIALFWDNRRSPELFLAELSKPVQIITNSPFIF